MLLRVLMTKRERGLIMKRYYGLEMEIVHFDVEEIITASSCSLVYEGDVVTDNSGFNCGQGYVLFDDYLD